MNPVTRLTVAIREGRLAVAVAWRARDAAAALREHRLRRALSLASPIVRELPSIQWTKSSAGGDRLFSSLEKTAAGGWQLPDYITAIEGMSGQKYRVLVNALIVATPDARYLEIGSWRGSTASAALYGNDASATCIDNWSLFGEPKETFLENVRKARPNGTNVRLIENDFRRVDYAGIGSFNVFLFDGPHEEQDHYDGISMPLPALDREFVLIVDDWNWRQVRNGTLQALVDSTCEVVAALEIRTMGSSVYHDHPSVWGTNSDWHNGYFVAVVRNGSSAIR